MFLPNDQETQGWGGALFSSTQQQNKRQWVQTRTQKVPSEHEEELSYFVGDRALVQVAQRNSSLL